MRNLYSFRNCISLLFFLLISFSNYLYSQTFVVGDGTVSNGGGNYPTSFGNNHFGVKSQFFVTAAQLNASGLQGGMSISSIGFNVVALNSVPHLENYSIKVYTTSSSNPLSSEFISTGHVATASVGSYLPILGWNHIGLDNSFVWNGTDNLVIETCSNNTSRVNNGNASVERPVSLGGGTVWSRWRAANDSSVCGSSSSTGSTTTRPNIAFGVNYKYFVSAGNHSFKVPSPETFPQGVSTILEVGVQAIGGGGAGASVRGNGTLINNSFVAGGGGGGGGYAKGKVRVTAGNTYTTLKVGVGGSSDNTRTHGGTSEFNGDGNLVRGTGGRTPPLLTVPNSGGDVGGDGEEGGSGIGNINVTNGGKGGKGYASNSLLFGNVYSGGGGSGAYLGNVNDGTNGTSSSAGIGGAGYQLGGTGGNGWSGDMNSDDRGYPGKKYGAGGGGASVITSASGRRTGGMGAPGVLVVNWMRIKGTSVHQINCEKNYSGELTILGENFDSESTNVLINNISRPIVSITHSTIIVDLSSNPIEANQNLTIVVDSHNGVTRFVTSTAPIMTDRKEFITNVGNWNVTANWSPNGVPTSNHCVYIPTGRSLTINSNDALAKSVEVKGKLIIESLGALTVQEDFINEGGEVVLKTDANLIQVDDDAQVSGFIRVERLVQDMNNVSPLFDYVYWSSPVDGQKLRGTEAEGGFSPNTPINGFMHYNEGNDYFYVVPAAETNFKPAKGYAIRAESILEDGYDKTYSFTGTPHNGLIDDFVLKYTHQGYNLVGNPYPSNIDADVFFGMNSNNIHTVVYLWTNNIPEPVQHGSNYNGNSYAIYNGTGGTPATSAASDPIDLEVGDFYIDAIPNGIIKVGQGFIVQAKEDSDGQPLIFANKNESDQMLRVSNPGTFYQRMSLQKDRFWIRLNSHGIANTALIGYVPGATNDFEMDYDAPILVESSDAIYTLLGEEKLLIQGREYPLNINDVVPLGVRFFASSKYIIDVPQKEGKFTANQRILLKDKYLNKLHNLSVSPYEFESPAGEFNDRFEIIYKNPLVTNFASQTQVIVSRQNAHIVIQSTDDLIREVEILNLFGRSIYKNSKVNNLELRIPAQSLEKQVLVVRVLTESGSVKTQKIINK